MKIKTVLTLFLLTVTILSCKDEKKEEITEKEVISKNIFTVTLNASVKKDDSFQLFYNNEIDAPFEQKKSLFVEFKGSEQPQDIVFKLPEDEVPFFFRLDFGSNKEQSEIIINKFKIDYLGKTVEIKGSDFFSYFYGNELTEKIDPTQGKVTPFITKDGNYDPMCASGEGLQKQIELIVK